MGRHAIAYLRKGWSVVPLWWVRQPPICACPMGDQCKSAGKHPHTKHGSSEPLTTATEVELYWARHPLCNIGIATGAASGLVVLDIDLAKDGARDSMRQLWRCYGPPGPTLVSVTGSGGRHVFFKHPGDKVRNVVGHMRGIDIRGDGGLVVVPPSLHGCGNRYLWHPSGHPRNKRVLPMPTWMDTFRAQAERKRRTRNSRYGGPSKYGRVFDPGSLPEIDEGRRNDTLCSIAGRLIHENRPDDEVMEIVQRVNGTHCKPPLPDKEITKLVTHACRRWAGR